MTMELADIYKIFKSRHESVTFLEKVRWKNMPKCPKCGSLKHSPLKDKSAYHCNFCNRTFTVTTDTIFHKSQLDLQKWFYAICQMINPEVNLTARALAADIGVTKDTAWTIQKKIKMGMVDNSALLLTIEKLITQNLGSNEQTS